MLEQNLFVPVMVLIVFSAVLIMIAIYFIIKLVRKHKSHNLFYHRYNLYLRTNSQRLKLLIDQKFITFKEINKPNNIDIEKNIDKLKLINLNCEDLIAAMNKPKDKRERDLLFDLNSLQDLPSLSNIFKLDDLREPMLLKDLIGYIFNYKDNKTINWIITKCFGPDGYYKHKNKVIYTYNGRLLVLEELPNKLLEPTPYNYNDLVVILNEIKVNKLYSKYSFALKHDNDVIIQKNIVVFRVFKKKINELEKLLLLVDSYDLYKNCASINDANKKQEHISKVTENTLNRIETMSGRRFISWIQTALHSLYKENIELKSDEQLGLYLLMASRDKDKSTIICVKRRQDKISSSLIRKLKDVQSRENCKEAWIITNNKYTHVSINLAKELNVKLIDNNELSKIVQKFNTNYYQGF